MERRQGKATTDGLTYQGSVRYGEAIGKGYDRYREYDDERELHGGGDR
jgi:hypothetical protein